MATGPCGPSRRETDWMWLNSFRAARLEAVSAVTSPEQLLAARFARGEINENEYRDRLAVLRDHAHP